MAYGNPVAQRIIRDFRIRYQGLSKTTLVCEQWQFTQPLEDTICQLRNLIHGHDNTDVLSMWENSNSLWDLDWSV